MNHVLKKANEQRKVFEVTTVVKIEFRTLDLVGSA